MHLREGTWAECKSDGVVYESVQSETNSYFNSLSLTTLATLPPQWTECQSLIRQLEKEKVGSGLAWLVKLAPSIAERYKVGPLLIKIVWHTSLSERVLYYAMLLIHPELGLLSASEKLRCRA